MTNAPSKESIKLRHYDNTYKDFTYNNFTYNISKFSITCMFLYLL